MPDARHVIWSIESSKKVSSIKKYLYEEWSENEVRYFLKRLRHFEQLVSHYPKIYPASTKYPQFRRAVITKYQSAIYEIGEDVIKIHTVFDHRQHK